MQSPCSITKAATATVLLRVKLKVYFETQCKLLAGNPPEQKQAPPFQATEACQTLSQVAFYQVPDADTGMVCGKHKVRQQSEPWGTVSIQPTSTLTALNFVR